MRKSKNVRRNAKLYPIYKMFSWDLLFFYSIEYLFYTITKNITVSQILIANAYFLTFKVIFQIPASIIIDHIGKRKSMIIGNIIMLFHPLALIFVPGISGLIIANTAFAMGYDLKLFSETNLLYDSVATKGGDGLFSKIDSRGGIGYYLLDGIASLTAGYLFVINNYIPVIICFILLLISTILSFGFKEIYPKKHIEKIDYKKAISDYKKTFKFVFNSGRMKALILFQVVFYSLIKVIDTYRSDLLVNIGISAEQFSMIFAILSLIGALSLAWKESIENKFKNKTLMFISLSYIISCILIGVIASIFTGSAIIPIILILCVVQRMSSSTWWVLESKYLKNFTNEKTRGKITFAYEFIGGISASIVSLIASALIDNVSVGNAYLLLGLASLAAMVVTLDYMKKRIGLKPSQYKKSDIKLEIK